MSDARTHSPVSNISSSRPVFSVGGLVPGEGYIVTVTATNVKGRSEPMSLHAFTLKETSPKQIVADTSRHPGLVITPVLAILIAIGAGLALVAVSIIIVMRIKHGPAVRNNEYQETHIHLQKNMGSNWGREGEDRHPDIIPSNKGQSERFNNKI